MQQKEISRWLKAITIVLALMGAVFFLYIMPVLAMSWRDAFLCRGCCTAGALR